MPHYLIEIAAPPATSEQILNQPRAYLNGVRSVATELGGQLDGCWFVDGGERVIALLHMSQQADSAMLQEMFAKVWQGTDVRVRALLTLRELNSESPAEDVLVRTELWSDPVDLGSDLSFPASDPPVWIYRERIVSEETL